MARRPTNRLFQNNEYRLYSPDDSPDISATHVPFFIKRHSNREMGNRISFGKDKIQLIRKAAATIHLELMEISNKDANVVTKDRRQNGTILEILPKEVLLRILSRLDVSDLSSFIKTCHCAKWTGYDNFLWKEICYCTWNDPTFMQVDLLRNGDMLRLWYNWNAGKRHNKTQVIALFQNNLWRLIYAALTSLDLIPSIVDSMRIFFVHRTIECYGTARQVKYDSTEGNFRLEGVTHVSRVEYTVFNVLQPWHRKQYIDVRPLPIFELKNYGLKITRSVRGQNLAGFFRRRGYYLKSDKNRKVHLAYRYFPTIRFRLYRQKSKVFLLCQDLFMNGGETIDCYTMYEIVKVEEEDEQTENVARDSERNEADQEINPLNDLSQHLNPYDDNEALSPFPAINELETNTGTANGSSSFSA